MKKLLLLFCLLLLVLRPGFIYSQALAMDVEQDECDGPSHHLYTELDAGNVVIMEFVMLNCAPCIVGTKALESITAPYEATNPGRVHIYSFGFLDSYTCEQILAWKSDNKFTHPVFINGEDQVNYYGGMGMPTIVVTGTNQHKVFFKSIGYTSGLDDEIMQAIDSALMYNPTGVEEDLISDQFKIYPTMFSDHLNIETGSALAGAELFVYDAFGRQVIDVEIPESGKIMLPVEEILNGIYIARIRNENGLSEGIKLIKQ